MLKELKYETQSDEVAYSQAGTSVSLECAKGLMFVSSATVTTPSADNLPPLM